ncbi:hypothetical protein XA68_12778 [Ophiocordyceps unilateralis]|uniref:Aminotransferase class I/classII large domain-containing protein n=1 Tax=Ophiocordyceps unilateralis TaxID=268505 RepID=A0A2A9PDX1_OPHUN|nr:hypothetical protein XA68_12778 [Ophiocordyceps unilateralis]
MADSRLINLLRGWPSPTVLPASLLSGACQRVLADATASTSVLQYGPDRGHQPLREGLASWLAQQYGVGRDAERICITGGASQSLACILQSFTDPSYTRAVWIVEPCYHLGCGIFEDAGFGGRLRAAPGDEEGVDVDGLERMMKEVDELADETPEQQTMLKVPGPTRKIYRHVIYCVATCSNPSGITMSLRRRESLVRLARSHDALIISDDVYDFLQWPLQGDAHLGVPTLPRLCDVDLAMGLQDGPFGHAISNGSFSKIAGPGMRTGWVEASTAFVAGLGDTASTLSGGAAKAYRRGASAHLVPLGFQARESSLAGSDWYGGYFIWLTASSTTTTMPPPRLVAEAAMREASVVIGPGTMFEVRGDERRTRFDGEIRLCFAWEEEEALVQGVRRLGLLLKRMQEDRGYYDGLVASYGQGAKLDEYK